MFVPQPVNAIRFASGVATSPESTDSGNSNAHESQLRSTRTTTHRGSCPARKPDDGQLSDSIEVRDGGLEPSARARFIGVSGLDVALADRAPQSPRWAEPRVATVEDLVADEGLRQRELDATVHMQVGPDEAAIGLCVEVTRAAVSPCRVGQRRR